MKSIAAFSDLLLLLASYGFLDLRHCAVEAMDFVTFVEKKRRSSTLAVMGEVNERIRMIHKVLRRSNLARFGTISLVVE